MSVTRAFTVAFEGLEARAVDVQVHMGGGLPAFTVVGLPDKAVAESRERVRAALAAIGLGLPPKRITVNLAPADLPKEGSHYDLPIALALLAFMGALPPAEIERYTALGELALDGTLTPVAGVLPAAVSAAAQGRGIICPAASGSEAAWAGEVEILAPTTLIALVNLARARARSRRRGAAASRSRRHQGSGNAEARARGRRRWRPQPLDDRSSRSRQVHVGAALAGHFAAAYAEGGARGFDDRFARGASRRRAHRTRAAVSQPAPLREHARARRRWAQGSAGRDFARPLRCALSR